MSPQPFTPQERFGDVPASSIPGVPCSALRPLALALPFLTALVAAGLTRPLAAQEEEGARWFPEGTAFTPLLADPLETGLRGGFLLVDRPDLEPLPPPPGGEAPPPRDFEGTNIEADVALGLRLPLVRFRPETDAGPEIALEFETGVFTRFFMEAPEKDLINADFRVGLPLSARWRRWEGRLELRHVSSHFGDDFVRRFDPPFRQISLEGFEMLVARRLGGGVRAYAGGEANFNVSDTETIRAGTERTAGRVGLEYDPSASGRGAPSARVWPFAAADFRVASSTDRVAGTGVAGIGFRVGEVGLRLEARGHYGPSSMGQLRTADERYWGLALRIEPRGAGFR